MPLTAKKFQLFRDFLEMYEHNRELFATKALWGENRRLFDAVVRSLGILNWENPDISGERRFLAETLAGKKEPVLIDVGAHGGEYCLLALEANPTARIFAFEPHPQTSVRLAAAAKAHGFAAFPAGCSDQDCGAVLYDYRDQPGSQHASIYREVIEHIHKGLAEAHHIRMIRLDDFIQDQGLTRVDLLKIDTEGHEMAVLAGAEAAIRAGLVRVIHFEFNEMNVYSRSFFKDFMDFLPGYRFFRLLPDGQVPLDTYKPLDFELFAYQNIAAVRQG